MSVESSSGKHGHGAVGEVNAGAAQARFLVERGVRRDVLRDIGNVDLQLEIAIGKISDGNRVVEVARGFAVDGDDGKRAEVAAVANFSRRDDGGYILRVFERRRGKFVRQVKFADGDFDVDAEVVLPAENFNDASARVLRGGGPVGDFNVDDDAFEIIPFRAARGFVSEYAVDGS